MLTHRKPQRVCWVSWTCRYQYTGHVEGRQTGAWRAGSFLSALKAARGIETLGRVRAFHVCLVSFSWLLFLVQDSVGAVTLCIICQSEDIPVSQSAEGGGWRVCSGDECQGFWVGLRWQSSSGGGRSLDGMMSLVLSVSLCSVWTVWCRNTFLFDSHSCDFIWTNSISRMNVS